MPRRTRRSSHRSLLPASSLFPPLLPSPYVILCVVESRKIKIKPCGCKITDKRTHTCNLVSLLTVVRRPTVRTVVLYGSFTAHNNTLKMRWFTTAEDDYLYGSVSLSVRLNATTRTSTDRCHSCTAYVCTRGQCKHWCSWIHIHCPTLSIYSTFDLSIKITIAYAYCQSWYHSKADVLGRSKMWVCASANRLSEKKKLFDLKVLKTAWFWGFWAEKWGYRYFSYRRYLSELF